MKRIVILILLVAVAATAFAACNRSKRKKPRNAIATDSVIALPKPDLTLSTSLMQALQNRHSERSFADSALSRQDLSSLLWAAAGVNRTESERRAKLAGAFPSRSEEDEVNREGGKRTNPTSGGANDVDIYVCLPEGTYLYEPESHSLRLVTAEDVRGHVSGIQPIKAPVFLLLVSDLSRFPKMMAAKEETAMRFGCNDVGIVSQNISLYCAAAGLVTVPRAMMSEQKLKDALGLTDSQVPLMNHPIGYPKK